MHASKPRFTAATGRTRGIRRTRPARSIHAVLRFGLGLGVSLASACSFQGEQDPSVERNSCTVDADCTTQHCQAGLCVAPAAHAPLTAALVVTPKRMPSGAQPVPIASMPFVLEPGKQPFTLQMPVAVQVKIVDQDTPIAAQVTFTTMGMKQENAFASKTTQINTVVADSGANNTALLMEGTEYRVSVQPVNARERSALTLQYTANPHEPLLVDYDQLKSPTRVFSVSNVPASGYNLRVRLQGGGPSVSNSVSLDALTVGTEAVQLVSLDPNSLDLPIEFELSPATTANSNAACSDDGPLRPTITMSSCALNHDGSLGFCSLPVPNLPTPITYSGEVRPCAGRLVKDGALPISLRATKITLGAGTIPTLAQYNTTTNAVWDEEAQVHKFCARVLPGEYTVVITPPANLDCEIFSERRTLKAQSGDELTEMFELRKSATLSGQILTPAGMPMANAVVELVALGENNIVLGPDDRTVPLYNRSKQVTTAADGMFVVPTDVGSYDLIVKPPAQSNYAWRVLYDLQVGSRTTQFTTLLNVTEPVVMSGKLNYASGSPTDQSSLASAEVHAYALVDADDKPRTVEVARGQADANGNITLLMPPELQKNWIPE